MDEDAAYHGIRFSTDRVAPRDRLPYLREAFGRSIARLDLGTYKGRPFRCALSLHTIDGVRVLAGRTSGITCRRTRPLLDDGNDDFLLTTNLSGDSLVSHVGRESRLGAGDATLLSTSDVGARDFPGRAEFLSIRIPRRSLGGMAVRPEDALARPIPANTEALRLLVDYVLMTLRKHQLASPQLRLLFATHVHDLAALAVGATREASEIVACRGLKAARLSAVKSDIMDRLGDEALTIADIAKRRSVTPRTVQLLFESEGVTFTEYVLGQRLARARRMLADPGLGNWTISAIAFEVGFGNLSYFNRMFRKRFGATPSDVRHREGAA